MAQFKTITFDHCNDAGVSQALKVSVQVSAEGQFYANLPEALRDAFPAALVGHSPRTPAGMFRAQSATFSALEDAIRQAHIDSLTPEVTEEPVILYNVESHVSFAVCDDGSIAPNAGFPGASWPRRPSAAARQVPVAPDYGDHHATNPAPNGYSLAIGARAMLKITHRFGGNTRVTYEMYHKGSSHLGRDNPAQLLNSWAAVGLGESPKEIPYTDEAALFFHKLLLAMADISRRVQEATFTQDRLLRSIATANAPLLGGPAAQEVSGPAAPQSGSIAVDYLRAQVGDQVQAVVAAMSDPS